MSTYTLYWQIGEDDINEVVCQNYDEAYEGMRTLEEDFRDYDDVAIWFEENI